MKPQRIQLSRKKGFKLPAGTVNCARPGKWGNEFKVGDGFPYNHSPKMDSKSTVEIFESYLKAGLLDFSERDVVRELRGKNLACWCKLGQPCHADVLLEIANQ